MTLFDFIFMKAEILPLTGKYYGTNIRVQDGDCEFKFSLWNNGSFEPSDRELGEKVTIEQWRKNEMVEIPANDWYPDGFCPAKEAIEICDGHFESRETYAAAKKIVDAINLSNQELHARVAVLEEEQRILARKYAPRLTDDDDDYVVLTEKGRALLEGRR